MLWQEVRTGSDSAIRRGLLARIGTALAERYRDSVSGGSPRERLERAAAIMRERQISCGVSATEGDLPVLVSYTCPYPELAEQDRGICAAERLMLQELVGSPVQLSECRLDGGSCCKFTASGEPTENGSAQRAGA